ncbi:MAG: PaaI family thioesterase [Acidimicrobiales bacterium]
MNDEVESAVADGLTVEQVNAYLRENMGFSVERGTTIEKIGPGFAVARQQYLEKNLRPGGIISGPTLMELTDLVVWVAIFTKVGIVPMAVTWDLKINFLRTARGGDVLATAKILKLGRSLAYASVDLAMDNNPDDLVAHATVTYSLPQEKPISHSSPS